MVKIHEAHQKFVNHLKNQSRSSATILAYGKDIEQLKNFLNELKKSQVQEINTKDLQAFMAKLQKEGYTPKSISRKTNSTKTFFRFLKINDFIVDDPAALLEQIHTLGRPRRTRCRTRRRGPAHRGCGHVRISAII